MVHKLKVLVCLLILSLPTCVKAGNLKAKKQSHMKKVLHEKQGGCQECGSDTQNILIAKDNKIINIKV